MVQYYFNIPVFDSEKQLVGDSECEFPPDFPPNFLTEKAAIEAVCGCLKDCEGEVTLWQLQMSQVIESSDPEDYLFIHANHSHYCSVMFYLRSFKQLNPESRLRPSPGLQFPCWYLGVWGSADCAQNSLLHFRRRQCAGGNVYWYVLLRWEMFFLNPKERNSILGKYGWWMLMITSHEKLGMV